MKVAELFIKLGIKSDRDDARRVEGVQEGLGKIKERGLAAKAAIVGVMYGFHRLTSNAQQAGTELKHFSNITGVNVKKLQQWEHAGRKANITTEEIRGAFQSVQQSMAAIDWGQGTPRSLTLLASTVKDFDETKMRDTFYILEKMQEAAGKLSAVDAQVIMGDLGISPNMLGAMRKGAFTADKMRGALTYSEKDIRNLSKMQSEWSDIFHTMEVSTGKVFAQDLHKIMPQLIELVKESAKLMTETTKLLNKLGAIDGIAKALGYTANVVSDMTKSLTGDDKIKKQYDKFKRFLEKNPNDGGAIYLRNLAEKTGDAGLAKTLARKAGAEKMLKGEQVNNNIKMINHITESVSAEDTAKAISKEINKTFRQKAGTVQ